MPLDNTGNYPAAARQLFKYAAEMMSLDSTGNYPAAARQLFKYAAEMMPYNNTGNYPAAARQLFKYAVEMLSLDNAGNYLITDDNLSDTIQVYNHSDMKYWILVLEMEQKRDYAGLIHMLTMVTADQL